MASEGPDGEPSSETPERAPEVSRLAAGLWQAAEAIRLLVEEAQRMGLPAPTVVSDRLTFAAMQGLATYTQRYAQHLAEQEQPRGSGLVVASPDELRRLLASMRLPGQESPRDR
jgi:hypothetical protein